MGRDGGDALRRNICCDKGMIRTEPRVILKAAAPELRRDYGFARVTVAPDQSMLGSQMSHARIEIDPAVTG